MHFYTSPKGRTLLLGNSLPIISHFLPYLYIFLVAYRSTTLFPHSNLNPMYEIHPDLLHFFRNTPSQITTIIIMALLRRLYVLL